MMKNISKILAVLFAMALSASVYAQPAVTANATASASAVIVAPISITKVVDLVFGTIVPDADGGTVTISPLDARTFGSGVSGLTSTTTSAEFNVSGTASQTYSITLPADGAIVLTGPGANMSLNTWTTSAGAGTLDGSGNQTLNVGATLNVGGGQVSGSYSGTFQVTVGYN